MIINSPHYFSLEKYMPSVKAMFVYLAFAVMSIALAVVADIQSMPTIASLAVVGSLSFSMYGSWLYLGGKKRYLKAVDKVEVALKKRVSMLDDNICALNDAIQCCNDDDFKSIKQVYADEISRIEKSRKYTLSAIERVGKLKILDYRDNQHSRKKLIAETFLMIDKSWREYVSVNFVRSI